MALMLSGARSVFPLLLLLALLLGAATAQAGEFCSDYPGGVIDGSDPALVLPSTITIDTDCTFQNFPESDPLDITVNFQTNDPSIYLIIFDNVIFTGHMACASVDHRIWFANGSDYGSSNSCQDLFIPVESIDKQSPAATAAVGEPFTYRLVLPSMQLSGDPSPNDLHTVILWDDLSREATGADLTYVDINAYYSDTSEPVTLVPENDPNARGGKWTEKNLSYEPIPLIDAGRQIVVEITVVLDDTLANAVGTSFTNTAKWWFGRLIEGEFYEPLPGEWGISEPMTIAGPELVVSKASDQTALNLGSTANFTIDVQNTGGSDAWDAVIVDQLPDGPDAGMCPAAAPAVSAGIVDADGTAVAALAAGPGADYTVSYSGAPDCRLTVAMQSAAAKIGPNQHLRITYQAQLDADTTADGAALTNVAGAIEWRSADNGGRVTTETLSDGTPGTVDHEDSYTITTGLSGYYFEKTVGNLDTGSNPATTAAPGDTLRYRLRLFNVDQTINDITVTDPLDPAKFDLSSFSMVTLPAGAASTFDPVTGELVISGDGTALDIAVGEELVAEFDITLGSSLTNGTVVENQATLAAAGGFTAESDDPYANGVASPDDPDDQDPTTVVIRTPGPLAKANPAETSAAIGEQFTYTVTVPAVPVDVPLYDVRILDDLAASGADLRFVRASVVAGGSWTLSNTGSSTSLVIEDTSTGIDIPAGGQATIAITVEMRNTGTNQEGLSFANTASYTYNRVNGSAATRKPGSAGSTGDMTVVEPVLAASKAVSFVSPADKEPTDPATVGDVLRYTVTVANGGSATAFDTTIVDTLPADVSLVAGSATAAIDGAAVAGFVATPTTLADGSLAWGRRNGDETLDIPAGQSLVLTYQVTVESVTGTDIANSVYADWTSLNGSSAAERTGDGCPGVTAPDDFCTGPASVSVGTVDNTAIAKAAVGDTYAEDPASGGDPAVRVGDTVTYELTLLLQEYTTRDVVVEDALPEGLAMASFTIEAGANFSYALTAQPAAGATGTLRWEFGDITNEPSNNGTPLDPLTIRYVATVLTQPPPTGVAHQASILPDNLARLSYTGGDPALHPERLTAAERIDVRQPLMQPISKVDLGSGRTGTGTATDPYQIDLANDVMSFRLSSCNDGAAPAYNLVITDQLAPELDEGDLASPPVVKIGAATLQEGTEYTYTAPGRGGEMRIALLDHVSVPPAGCVTAEYDLGFHTDLTASTTWSNQAAIPGYRSRPSAEPHRLYAPTDAAEVWMTNLVSEEQLLKTLASPASGEATVGDEVVYRIAVPAVPMNTALDGVVVTDTLHGALEYLGATAVDSGGAPVALTDTSAAPAVSLAVGHLAAGEQVIITLRTRVVNNDQANAGVTFANTADYTYAGKPADAVTASTSGPLTIIEPAVAVAKSVVNASHPGAAPNPGDILRYSVTFTAAGGAAGDDFAGAYDLEIDDSLGAGLAYQAGTARVDGVGNTIADPTVTGDGTATPQTLSWSPGDGNADIDVAEGTVVTMSYDVAVLAGVQPGQELTNSVTARWTGQNGADAFERSGSGTPAENDYVAGPAAITLATALDVSVVKSVVNVSTGEDPGANAQPGETLRYTLVITNGSIVPVNGGSVVDDLAAQFAPGSLVVTETAGGTDASDPTGGVHGTGRVHIKNLTLAAQGEATDSLTIVFEVTLAAVIPSGTTVLNQAELSGANLDSTASNETSTLISSAPAFRVLKTSQDLTGDPSILRAGDVLRYTITVKNSGNENATGVSLRDLIPAYTDYVAGTTRLNGALVADPVGGGSALANGMPVNAPENTTAGYLRADATATMDNVATITFEVKVDADVVDGTLIANQGFVNGSGEGSGPFTERPSDDPSTATVDDPTRDIIGNLPFLEATKTVAIQVDNGTTNVVDPGDVLRYTITVNNLGNVPATGVRLTDGVPAHTAYVADTVTLNGAPVGRPDGGVSPLVTGVAVNSPDSAAGIVAAGSSAAVTFDVAVNGGVAAGTAISNQGFVASTGLATEPTDADGADHNGDQPTVVVVGSGQQLSILKEVFDLNGGVVEAGDTLEYVVRVSNTGFQAAANVIITDNLAPFAGQVAYVGGSATLDGSATGVTLAGDLLTADYAAAQGDLPAGSSTVLRFRGVIDSSLPIGTAITNTGQVAWNTPTLTATSSVSVEVGAIPGAALLNGRVWHDVDFDNLHDDSELDLANWRVVLSRNDVQVGTATTDDEGGYRFSGLPPTVGSDQYELRFTAPGAGARTAKLGLAHSPFTNGPQQISGVTAASGSILQNLDLPIDPNGVVFNSVTRTPVAGAVLTLLNAATDEPLPAACFDDPAQQDQVTRHDGYYKFDLNFGDASCPADGTYTITVTPPPEGYVAPVSRIMPAASLTPATPFSVPACPGSPDDAVPATGEYCESTASASPPPLSVAPRTAGTIYRLYLTLSNGVIPGQSQIFNNHIPLDPVLDGAVAITKTSALLNATKGQLVPYTITVSNVYGVPLYDIGIVDRFPAGFKYVEDSARLDGTAVEPRGEGRELVWDGFDLQVNERHTLELLLVVGAGVSEGEYVNRARAINIASGETVSGEATATVRVVPDPTFDCTDAIGKVFDDRNLNGRQDRGEKGVAGVRVVTARGLIGTTDGHGRFHITCAVVPDEDRGSNFILKLDDRSLPSGYRVTTENPRVQRATRGKMMRINFGATVHRVVGLDIADGVFEPEATDLRLQWEPRLAILLEELQRAPAVLRLSYLADVEAEGLVGDRLETLKEEIAGRWNAAGGGYRLTIETEVFWRRGSPP